jgi:uncharacterized protein DUF1326
MAEVPRWRLTGDWFDVCRCRVPCGCSIAQAPNEGQCDGILAWHVREGRYGDVTLDGLNIVAVGSFEGNIWAGEAKPSMGFFIDERADEPARVQVHNAPEAEVGPGQVAFGPPPISERRKGVDGSARRIAPSSMYSLGPCEMSRWPRRRRRRESRA